jgi:SAM-dependent methyltransferase
MTATATPDEIDIDEQATEAFAGRLFELFTGAALSALIDIARRTGLFDAAAAGPATSSELAQRAGLQERYVREWLRAMATAGIVEYDPDNHRFWLPREHAVCLTGVSPRNMSGLALLTTILAEHVPGVTDAFRTGGGVPYDAFAPDIHDALDALWGPIYSQLLVPEYLPLVPGLPERLAAGARVADLACGTGRALVALASAFPASRFVGYDLDGAALDRARATATERRLTNVIFERADAAELRVGEPFDVVFVFNAIHDQARPDAALRSIHDALVPGGIFVIDPAGGQPRQPDGSVHLRREHVALPHRLPRRRRSRARHRVGRAARHRDAPGRRIRPCRCPRRAGRSRQRRLRHHP